RPYVTCELVLSDVRDYATAVSRLRRLLDLDADPGAVASTFGDDPLLGQLVRQCPGRRVPGSVDGAEMAMRAVLGQQISVEGARRLAGRLVEAHGEALDAHQWEGLWASFPGPSVLARVDPARLPMPAKR